jgi:hypothetical protein
VLVVKGRFTRSPPSRHLETRSDSSQTRVWLNHQRAERAGLKKLQAIPSGSCWFRRCCESIVDWHVAAAAVAAADAIAVEATKGFAVISSG